MNNIKRGEIYYADFPFAIGSEQSGSRPVLILQNNMNNHFSPTTIVAAITSQDKKLQPTHVPIPVGCLKRDSTVLLEQIRTIDKVRLGDYIGKLDKETMGKVDYAIITSLGIKTMEVLLK